MEGYYLIGREFLLEWEVLEMGSTDDGCTQMWILNDTDMVNGNFYVCFTTHTKNISCGGWGDLSQILVLRYLGGTRLIHVTNLLVGDPAQVIRTAPSGELCSREAGAKLSLTHPAFPINISKLGKRNLLWGGYVSLWIFIWTCCFLSGPLKHIYTQANLFDSSKTLLTINVIHVYCHQQMQKGTHKEVTNI